MNNRVLESIPSAKRGPAGQSVWRDPELARMLREHREKRGVHAVGLAAASWANHGTPLDTVEIHRLERAARHPTPWAINAYIKVLGLDDTAAVALIRRWGLHPKYRDALGPNPTMKSWAEFLKQHGPPLPITRPVQPNRLKSHRGGLVSGNVKVRFSTVEDALVRTTAAVRDTTVSDLVRNAIHDAIEHRREFSGRPSDAVRSEERNVRLQLSDSAIRVIEEISHGLEFAAWARLAVLDYIETGRVFAKSTVPA